LIELEPNNKLKKKRIYIKLKKKRMYDNLIRKINLCIARVN